MRFVLFVCIVQSILLFGHWFLYRTLVRFFGLANPSVLLTMRVGMALLSVSLVATSFLAFRYSNLLVRCLYTGAASWLGMFHFLIPAAILAWILYGLAKLFHFPLDRKILIEILIGMAFVASLYGFINAAVIRITRINVQPPGLSSSWKGKTAVWGSDTHFYDSTKYLQAVRRAGMRVLYNEKVELDGLQIIGVDYRDTRREEPFKSILKKIGIDRQKPSILLKHAPLHLQAARDHGITLQLSGHTHHGQVFLFRFITSRVYQGYDYGLKRSGDFSVYTSSGAGTWGPPMRVDTKPEIVVITFR